MEADDRQAALDALFWRDEILQVLFWMQGEGFLQAVSAQDLQPFLHGDRQTIAYYLGKFADEGLLVRHQESRNGEVASKRYALSEQGHEEGLRRFSEAFSGMQKQGHGACSPDCDCEWGTEGHDESCPHHHSH